MSKTIQLKLDKKAVRNSNIMNWAIMPMVLFGASIILYRSIYEAESKFSIFFAIGIAALILWIVKILWNLIHEQNRQLRDGTILYKLTPDGISNHYGNFHNWNEFKKIYFYKGSVHMSFMSNPSHSLIISNTGINPTEFLEAYKFIKTHAPIEATKRFKPK